MGAQADPEGRIFDSLDFFDIGRGNVWGPERSCKGGLMSAVYVLSMVSF